MPMAGAATLAAQGWQMTVGARSAGDTRRLSVRRGHIRPYGARRSTRILAHCGWDSLPSGGAQSQARPLAPAMSVVRTLDREGDVLGRRGRHFDACSQGVRERSHGHRMVDKQRQAGQGRQRAWHGRTEIGTRGPHAATMTTTHEDQRASKHPHA